MKKRMLSILLTLCMVLPLLPATALAGGVETDGSYLVVSDWEGLMSAVETIETVTATPAYRGIKVKADNFGWPDEGGTLVIDFEDDQKTTTGASVAGNQYYIYLVGAYGMDGCAWEIPENVTLQCYERLYLGDSYGANSTVTVNGKVEFMDYGTFGNNYYPYAAATVTVNGTLNTSAGSNSTNLTNVGLAVSDGGTLNVLYRCNLGQVSIAAGAAVNIDAGATISGTLTLADGVHLTGQGLSLQGDLVATGSAVVENYLQIYHNSTGSETVTLSGNLVLGAVQPYGTSPVLTIPAGSNVSVERLYSASGVSVTVAGVLNLTGGHSSFDNSALTIQSGGTVKMQPTVQFGGSSSNSAITGEGTLELYGILREQTTSGGKSYTYCDSCPRIFDIYSDKTDENGSYVPLTGVDEESLTVKRMWAGCTHTYGGAETVPATCGTQGYDIQTCTQCGTQLRSNYVPATGAHTAVYTKVSQNSVEVTCSQCESGFLVEITVPEGPYVANGAPKTPAELSRTDILTEWGLPIPTIQYENNVEPGTATASAVFGGVTISTTFEISGCAHEGGEATCTSGPICSKCGLEYGDPLSHTGGAATCKEQATCELCGQKYGGKAHHTYVLKSDAAMHWVECSFCGLEYLQDYGLDAASPSQIPDEVLLEMICVYLEHQGGGTKDQSAYLEQYGNTPSRHAYSGADCAKAGVCLLCGYEKAAGSHIWDEGEVTTAPTCTEKGVKTYTCSGCGGTKTEEIPALGHGLRYTASGAVITETCSRCDHTAAATLAAGSAFYTGQAVQTAVVTYEGGWQGGGLSIAYTDNVNAGTAAASITAGGQTASVTFPIAKAAAHTLTLGNLSQTSGSVSPVTWTVTPEDGTAQVQVEYEITVPASPCTHVHDASCGGNGAGCTHAHDASCGYAQAGKVWTGTLPTQAGAYPVRARLTSSENLKLAGEGAYATGVLTIAMESSGGGDGGGSASAAPDEPGTTTGGGAAAAEIKAKAATSGATSRASVSQNALDKAIEAAENAAVEIVVNTPAQATEVMVDLPAGGLEHFAGSKAQSLTISSGVGSLTISPEAAASMAEQAQGDTVTVTISEVTQPGKTLNERQLAAVGGAAVYDLSVTSGGKYITDFGGGLITVSLPYALKADEDPNGVVVCYVDGLGNLQRVRAMYDVKAQSIIFTTNHFSFYMVRYDSDAAAAARFTDVPFDAYYHSAVGWAVSHGVTSGVTETTFAPDAPCTRAQAVTFLWHAAGSPAPKADANPFADVKADAYYYGAVLWAVENGITAGTSATTFSPDAPCTRAQIVTFLWRAQKAPAADGVNPFTDVAADAYYAGAVLWAAENKITSGTSADIFSPDADCTRAQIVTFLWLCMGG